MTKTILNVELYQFIKRNGTVEYETTVQYEDAAGDQEVETTYGFAPFYDFIQSQGVSGYGVDTLFTTDDKKPDTCVIWTRAYRLGR